MRAEAAEADELVQRLLHRSSRVQDQALVEAVQVGAENALVKALMSASGWTRVPLAAALGDLRAPGPADEYLVKLVGSRGAGT